MDIQYLNLEENPKRYINARFGDEVSNFIAKMCTLNCKRYDKKRRDIMNEETQKKCIKKHGMNLQMSEDVRQDFIQKVLLNHCECGMPEESLKYIHKILNIFKDSGDQDSEDLNRLFYDDNGLKYTIFYMLHKYGLTEHSLYHGSVPGKLTPDGQKLLEDLNKLYPKNKE